MRLTFLGTGTSCGVPVIGCRCTVCQSANPKDKRLRSSALVETATTRLLIDCGPDFRQQVMALPFRRIDGILVTHSHYDHMGGMDDIRPYCQFGAISVYADAAACDSLLQMLPYCFEENRYPGVPAIGLHAIEPHVPLTIGDITVTPLRVMHGQLPILGFRLAQAATACSPAATLTYITDMKTIDDAEAGYAEGSDVLVVNALRQKPHHSHQTLAEAVGFARRVAARRTYFIHSSHDIGLHDEVNRQLPAGMQLAFDGLSVSINP